MSPADKTGHNSSPCNIIFLDAPNSYTPDSLLKTPACLWSVCRQASLGRGAHLFAGSMPNSLYEKKKWNIFLRYNTFSSFYLSYGVRVLGSWPRWSPSIYGNPWKGSSLKDSAYTVYIRKQKSHVRYLTFSISPPIFWVLIIVSFAQ